MKKKLLLGFFICTFSFGLCSFAMADWVDFIDADKREKQDDICAQRSEKCRNKCNSESTYKETKKCYAVCHDKSETCFSRAATNAVMENKLPSKAKKEFKKIVENENKRRAKCEATFTKSMKKCFKKKDKGKKESCLNNATAKNAKCNDKATKWLGKTKLKKLLKGKTPE